MHAGVMMPPFSPHPIPGLYMLPPRVPPRPGQIIMGYETCSANVRCGREGRERGGEREGGGSWAPGTPQEGLGCMLCLCFFSISEPRMLLPRPGKSSWAGCGDLQCGRRKGEGTGRDPTCGNGAWHGEAWYGMVWHGLPSWHCHGMTWFSYAVPTWEMEVITRQPTRHAMIM